MKIALVSPYDFAYPGGVVAHISGLCEHLEKRGHVVKILAPATSTEDLGLKNLIAVGRSVPVPSGGSGSVARISLSVWRTGEVKSLLREEKFDIVHLHEPLTPVLPLEVLGASNVPNVGTFHRFDRRGLLYQFAKYPLGHWFRKLDTHIAVSRSAREYVNRHFPANYQIIPNGIDVDFFASKVPPLDAFMDGKLNILFVGRMEKRKGLKYLLGAISLLKWDHPHIRLIVVGPGNPGGECYRLLAERNVQDVVFVGKVSPEMLRRYYRTADIFCSPAIGEESFGIVLGEAMASGKPIVATDIEGYSDVVEDGVQGILVPPRSEEAIAKALERLIRDKNLRKEMAHNGRVHVEQYRWDRVTEKVLECYKYAIANHHIASSVSRL